MSPPPSPAATSTAPRERIGQPGATRPTHTLPSPRGAGAVPQRGVPAGKGNSPGTPPQSPHPAKLHAEGESSKSRGPRCWPCALSLQDPPETWAWCQAGGTRRLPGAPSTPGQRAWGASAKGGFIPARAAPGCWRLPTRRDFFFFKTPAFNSQPKQLFPRDSSRRGEKAEPLRTLESGPR